MTNRLADLLNIPHTPRKSETLQEAEVVELNETTPQLEEMMREAEKISAALPLVTGLTNSEIELDRLSKKAADAYEDILDLGLEADIRYKSRLFEVAATMLNAAITANSLKTDKKLKMVELQLKKYAIDKKEDKSGNNGARVVEAEGVVVTSRNNLLASYRERK